MHSERCVVAVSLLSLAQTSNGTLIGYHTKQFETQPTGAAGPIGQAFDLGLDVGAATGHAEERLRSISH